MEVVIRASLPSREYAMSSLGAWTIEPESPISSQIQFTAAKLVLCFLGSVHPFGLRVSTLAGAVCSSIVIYTLLREIRRPRKRQNSVPSSGRDHSDLKQSVDAPSSS